MLSPPDRSPAQRTNVLRSANEQYIDWRLLSVAEDRLRDKYPVV